MNFLDSLKDETNFDFTENGAVKHKTTKSDVLDMFALCGSYRNRSEEDCITMLENALKENETLAVKCLFYLADCRGGQGERRFFRVCYRWLANKHTEIALRNLKAIPEYRRYDDILYSCVGTPIENDALAFIKEQFILDIQCKTPSLLAKWLPSENASSAETKRMGNIVREYLGMTHKQYRKSLVELRSRINIVEKLMSQNRWDEIEFDKIPSKAGLVYKNAFSRRDILSKKYETFMKDETTKVNATTLYPYEIVEKAIHSRHTLLEDIDRVAIEKYWQSLPNYLENDNKNMLCVVDTSGSMHGTPINVAISLGIYAAERAKGVFKNHYISFSSRPQLIEIKGADFVDKVNRIYQTNLCENTDLTKTFDMLLNIANCPDVAEDDIPSDIIVISDMEIDGDNWMRRYSNTWTKESAATEMEKIRKKWATYGHKLPRLVYWNVDARQDTILDSGPNVSFVSGFSPTIFKQVVTGKTGIELMLDILLSERYKAVH